MTGRTVMGQDAPRGQGMCDHYMAPLSLTSPALACMQVAILPPRPSYAHTPNKHPNTLTMQEIQRQCFQLGIPLRTRHREVAPNQYEFAPLFGPVTMQVSVSNANNTST